MALYSGLANGDCKILYSGIILNLLNLRPQICCVLLIENAEWFEKQARECGANGGKSKGISTNWEYVDRRKIVQSSQRLRTEYDFEDIEAQLVEGFAGGDPCALAAQIAGRWIPDGLASLWLGIEAVREHWSGQRQAAEFTAYLDTH